MRLLKLSANVGSFRTVKFNRTGLSFVFAEQKAPRTNRTKTYNGVGKSLMLAILDYCLGSNAKPAFKTHLPGWIFYLEIETDDGKHTIARSADEPSDIRWDTQEKTLKELKEHLELASFPIPEDYSNLSFRSLLGHFLRFGKGAYTDYKLTSIDESKNEYAVMLRNAFLLGLDPQLASQKHELRKQQLKLADTVKQLDHDPLFSELLAGDTVDLELVALQDQADRLKRDLEQFRVAENYHQIEQEADEIKRGLDHLRRERAKLEQAIQQIERSLATKADLPTARVYQLYEEANAKLPEAVIRTIDEVIAFQHSLKAKRLHRLTQDRQDLQKQMKAIDAQVKVASESLDNKVRYLGEHRALDEYLAVTQELSEAQVKIARLEESKSVREKVMVRQREIKLELAEQNIETATYLESSKELIAEAAGVFRTFSKRLYGVRRSGLIVSTDDGENQQRYKIDAHIEADAAEGIGEARLFCYDLMLLNLRRNHHMKFLAHDSTLFGPIDPRQRFTMLQVAAQIAEDGDFQYIATLNEHDVTSMRSQVELAEGEFETLFNDKTIVLRLSDDRADRKLLGITVDMNYREE